MAKRKKRGAASRPGPTETERLIRRAKKEAVDEAVRLTVTLMLTVLLDKFAAEEYIRDVYDAWNKLAEEVRDGSVKLHELRQVLREEYEIWI